MKKKRICESSYKSRLEFSDFFPSKLLYKSLEINTHIFDHQLLRRHLTQPKGPWNENANSIVPTLVLHVPTNFTEYVAQKV